MSSPVTHIKRIAFCGIRRLNKFESKKPHSLTGWQNQRSWCHFQTVNIFIGVNGGGKSTLLELIDLLKNPTRIITLPRENHDNNCLTAFEIDFSNGRRIKCQVLPFKSRQYPNASNLDDATEEAQAVTMQGFIETRPVFSFVKNISKTSLDSESAAELRKGFETFKCNVEYWTPDAQIPADNLIEILNKAAVHLPGVLSTNFVPENKWDADMAWEEKKENPFQPHDERRISVYLSDDTAQPSHIHTASLPSGWRALASIIHWLKNVPDGSVCLLEEPETHLHPRLQRHLARELEDVAEEKTLQLFISTHSTIFQHVNVWSKSPTIFEATAERIDQLTSPWRLMDALGIRGSDISQSNGVIWVEGPSDRHYIKHWLHLFCIATGRKKEFKENVDYSFGFYGGAILSHFSAGEQKSFISMLSMNRNMVLVMDRDMDFREDASGKLHPLNPKSAKARILAELSKLDSKRCNVWITDEYCIEAYLPDAMRTEYFDVDKNMKLLKNTKVTVSIKYTENYKKWESCSSLFTKLHGHIDSLVKAITCWNL